MSGKGVYTWPTGRVYDGDFKNDLRHGVGVLKFPDGQKYEGQFQNNKYHGEGVYTNLQGVAKRYIWRDGKKVRK